MENGTRRKYNSIGNKDSKIRTMTSMCGSGKSHAVMNASGYYRPSPYTYQVSFILNIVLSHFNMLLTKEFQITLFVVIFHQIAQSLLRGI